MHSNSAIAVEQKKNVKWPESTWNECGIVFWLKVLAKDIGGKSEKKPTECSLMYHSSIKQTDTRSLTAPERINPTTRIRDWKKCYVDTDKKSPDVILRVRVRFRRCTQKTLAVWNVENLLMCL